METSFFGAHNRQMPKVSKVRQEDVLAIAARLRALRATTGLSQRAFAESVGLEYKQWGNFESAVGRIGIDAALTLTRELRVPLDWIYLGEEAWLSANLRDQLRAVAADLEPSSDPKRA